MVSAIVMAAGLSSRMGEQNKLLLPFKNKSIIETTIANIIGAGMEEIIIVLGDEADKIKNAIIDLPVKTIYNPDYKNGLTGTIQQGIRQAKGNGFMLCLSDMVLINSGEQQVFIDPHCICVPVYNGQKGNPVLFSSNYKEKILSEKEKEGCKGIVQANKENIFMVEMQTSHVLQDIDSLDDYNKLILKQAFKLQYNQDQVKIGIKLAKHFRTGWHYSMKS